MPRTGSTVEPIVKTVAKALRDQGIGSAAYLKWEAGLLDSRTYGPQAAWIRARPEVLVTLMDRFVPVPLNLAMAYVFPVSSPAHQQLPIP
jgi:hypothetical protein